MNLTTLLTRARSLLTEPTAGFYSDTDLTGWANDGLSIITGDTESIENVKTDSSVQYQQEYTLPTDCVKPTLVYWEDTPLDEIDWDEWLRKYSASNLADSGDPERFVAWNNKLYLHKIPSASATTTTQTGNHTSTITSVVVASTTGFPTIGKMKIGSETIAYTNTTATKFAGCSRGEEGSTATSHLASVTVTEKDITIVYYGQQTSDLSGTATPSIPARYHILIVYYMAWMGFLKAKEISLAREYGNMFSKGVAEMKRQLKLERYRYPIVKDRQMYGR